MRKPSGRTVLKLTAGVAAAIAIMLLACLEGVDYRPYFRQPYYQETIARLNTNLTNSSVIHGELYAGFGSALLTPSIGAPADDPEHGKFRNLPLAGYGNRAGKPATGTHDDVHVKAAAIRVGGRLEVMVAADALIIPPEITELAAQKLQVQDGLRRDQLYLGATHTHCSLGGWGEGKVAESFAGGFQAGARIWFANQIVSAVHMAVADLKPAEFGSGSFPAPQFVRNRLVGTQGTIDPEFSFVVLKQREGKTAVLGSYSAHATVLSGAMMEFSGDYPGCWQRAIEDNTHGIAIFFAGAVGSHGPVPPVGGWEGAKKMGNSLAAMVLETIPGIRFTNSVTFGSVSAEVTLPPLNARVRDSIRLRPWLAARLLPPVRKPFLQAVRIENLIWISTPCDFSGELALGIKDALHTHDANVLITSFNGDYVGYVIPSRYYHLDGYEPRLMSFFGPYVPDYLDELMRAMAINLADK